MFVFNIIHADRAITVCNVHFLTYKLLVPDIQRHVSQSGGHGAHHSVVIHPQELHEDGESLLLTHRSADVRCKLHTHTKQMTCILARGLS